MIGYAVAGAFLGMSHFDLPYHLIVILVLAAKFSGVLDKVPQGSIANGMGVVPHPSARWAKSNAWQRE